MHSVLVIVNGAVEQLNRIDPTWYIIIVGPLASAAQHAIKLERAYSKRANIFIWLGLSALGGILFAVLQSPSLQLFWVNFTRTFPAIALTANLTYQAVYKKYEELNSQKQAEVAPATTSEVKAAPEATTTANDF